MGEILNKSAEAQHNPLEQAREKFEGLFKKIENDGKIIYSHDGYKTSIIGLKDKETEKKIIVFTTKTKDGKDVEEITLSLNADKFSFKKEVAGQDPVLGSNMEDVDGIMKKISGTILAHQFQNAATYKPDKDNGEKNKEAQQFLNENINAWNNKY